MPAGSNSYAFLFKLVVIGDSGVGKSALLKRLSDNQFTGGCNHTAGVEFGTKMLDIRDQPIKLQIWDTAGADRYQAITRSYYRCTPGCLLVFDVTNRKSFERLGVWLNDFQSLANRNGSIMIVGNKIDAERAVSKEEAQQYAKQAGCLYAETSAKSGEGVTGAFTAISQAIYDKVQSGSLHPDHDDSGVKSGPLYLTTAAQHQEERSPAADSSAPTFSASDAATRYYRHGGNPLRAAFWSVCSNEFVRERILVRSANNTEPNSASKQLATYYGLSR